MVAAGIHFRRRYVFCVDAGIQLGVVLGVPLVSGWLVAGRRPDLDALHLFTRRKTLRMAVSWPKLIFGLYIFRLSSRYQFKSSREVIWCHHHLFATN